MKRIILLALVLVVMFVSIGGCLIGLEGDGRGERGGEHDRDRGHDRDQRHDERR
jgi:hypothetical protein